MNRFKTKRTVIVLILVVIFCFSLLHLFKERESHQNYKKNTLIDKILDRIDKIRIRFDEWRIADFKKSLPHYDLKKGVYGLDFFGEDLSNMDLHSFKKELETISFDTRTKWPPASKFPSDFNPAKMIEKGKYPGLGLRKLHQLGFTGKGVNVAIIDHRLPNKDHIEYRNQLKYYEQVVPEKGSFEMHGPLVASLLVGSNTGTAPEANLYYFGTHWGFDIDKSQAQINTAKAIRRIIYFNRTQPPEKRIRLVSISYGFPMSDVSSKAAKEWDETFKEAQRDGIIVVTVGFDISHWLNLKKDKCNKFRKFFLCPLVENNDSYLQGARCPWNKDRDNPLNYDKAYLIKWLDEQKEFINTALTNSKTWQEFKKQILAEREELLKPTGSTKCDTAYTFGLARVLNRLPSISSKFKTPSDYISFVKSLPSKHFHQIWIPIGDRTCASEIGRTEYLFMGDGGMSSGVPYFVGVMALILQANPKLTNCELVKIMDKAVTILPKGVRLICPEEAIKLAKESIRKK